MREINKIIVHCSATREGENFEVAEIRKWHLARGFNDIGYHFPPTENKWKNCDSFVFLKHALSKLEKKNAELIHIDSVIITESPKILDYVDEIKNKISNSTGINKKILSIKGKSNEGIGFIGRKEGIAVLSNTTIKITDD